MSPAHLLHPTAHSGFIIGAALKADCQISDHLLLHCIGKHIHFPYLSLIHMKLHLDTAPGKPASHLIFKGDLSSILPLPGFKLSCHGPDLIFRKAAFVHSFSIQPINPGKCPYQGFLHPAHSQVRAEFAQVCHSRLHGGNPFGCQLFLGHVQIPGHILFVRIQKHGSVMVTAVTGMIECIA